MTQSPLNGDSVSIVMCQGTFNFTLLSPDEAAVARAEDKGGKEGD